MVRRSFPLFIAAWLCPWLIVAARAQEPAVDAPAHISVVDGAVVLERDGRAETAPASMPLLAGDRVRTDNGRVEILFDDGSTLHLDTNTTVDFQSDEVVRLLDGRIRLNIAGASRSVSYRIDAPGAWIQVTQPGEYRVSLVGGDHGAEVELAVLRGAAELVNEDGRTPLRAGERAFAHAGQAPSYAYVFNSAAWDAFDRWSEARRDQRLALSAQYLPNEVRPYAGTFDSYGNWQYQPTYGYVWYPRVSVGWRPYYYGRWTSLRPYGWTWIGTDLWAWPTHHYGRWGFSAGAWFWIPGRRWAPAWVSWAYAPGYVSWCPLGWDNRPVMQFVNLYRGYRGYDPWRAWTVVPQRHFGVDYVNVRASARVDPRAFQVRAVAPMTAGHAMPRSAAPIRVAGTRAGTAMPRGEWAAPSGAAPNTYRAAPQTPAQPSEARDAFRSRGASGGALSGPGFPAASRAPREPGALPSRPGVAVPRGSSQPSTSAPVQYGDRSGDRSVMPRAASPSYDRPDRRAVPSYRNDAPASPAYEVPGRRAVPSYRNDAPAGMSPGGRAMPRNSEGAGGTYGVPSYGRPPMSPQRVDPPSAPSPMMPPADYGRPGGRTMPRSDGGGYRAPAGPPAGYRSSPGMERSAPAGPPSGYRSAPSGERSAPSGPPPSAGPRSGDRPSGGRPSGGSAVRRPGGGV